MEKLVYSRDLKSLAERHPGSTPGTRTNYFKGTNHDQYERMDGIS